MNPPLMPGAGKPTLTAAEVNALPDRVRRYIMMLETDCDPSGTIRSEMHLRDMVEALELRVLELQRVAREDSV